MEYGHNNYPEATPVEESERRLALKATLAHRTYQIVEKIKGEDDMPIARQFSMFDLYLATEAKNAIVLDMPGQQILPIEFSE